jgi:hypothetical protein
MFCQKCGAELGGSQKSCRNCAASLTSGTVESHPKRKNSPSARVILLSLAILFGLVVLHGVTSNTEKATQQNSVTPPPLEVPSAQKARSDTGRGGQQNTLPAAQAQPKEKTFVEPPPNPNTTQKPSDESTGRSFIAKPPFHPNRVAEAFNAVPGAIVCPDFRAVSLLFHLYSEHWAEEVNSRMTGGQSEVIGGPTTPAPVPADYGCWLLAPGTPVETKNGEDLLNGIPKVVAQLPDGTIIHGVTLPNMLAASKATR